MGFPSDLGRKVAKNAWAAFPSVEVTKVERPVDIEKFDPSHCFLVKYQSAGSRHPRGFSGGGLWLHKGPTTVWHPNLRLAGVCTNYYRSRQLLEIERVEDVIKFLQRFWS
jgi:hypothetical protein